MKNGDSWSSSGISPVSPSYVQHAADPVVPLINLLTYGLLGFQTYVYSVVYMASHDPSKYQYSTLGYVAIYTTLCTAYYVYVFHFCQTFTHNADVWVRSGPHYSWDTAMSQKSRFKMQTQGITTYRKTFPQLPWGTLKNPKSIQTAHG